MAWSTRTTEIDGREAQVLIDDRFRQSHPHELPRLAWFGVYTLRDPDGHFWHPDETQALDAIEDDLIRLCEVFGKGWAVYVLRIATPGIREYFVYRGERAELVAGLPSLKAAHPQYKIEYDETSDPLWHRYATCLPAATTFRS